MPRKKLGFFDRGDVIGADRGSASSDQADAEFWRTAHELGKRALAKWTEAALVVRKKRKWHFGQERGPGGECDLGQHGGMARAGKRREQDRAGLAKLLESVVPHLGRLYRLELGAQMTHEDLRKRPFE